MLTTICMVYVMLSQRMIYSNAIKFSLPKVDDVVLFDTPLSGISGKNTIILDCKATGDSVTLNWEVNGTAVVNGEDENVRMKWGNSRLIIEEVHQWNTGTYRCYASNSFGTVFGETFVQVRTMGSFNAAPEAYKVPHFVDGIIGLPLRIPCPSHNEGLGQIYWWGDLPAHSPPVLWKAGEPSTLGFSAQHGEFIFAYLRQEDVNELNSQGGISCILYQEKHSVQSIKIKINVTGNENMTRAAAKMAAFMPENMVQLSETSSFSMTCGATGSPAPEIRWYKDDVEILNTLDKKVITGNGMVLNIRPVEMSSGGVYKCVASNNLGSSWKQGTLRVHSKPRFLKELPGKTDVIYGDELKLVCKADSVPPSRYQWYHNNTMITSNGEFNIDMGSLVIKETLFNHTGIYMCVASNQHKTTVSPGYVDVKAVAPHFDQLFEEPVYFFKKYKSELLCNFTGRPEPKRSWEFDLKLITNSGGYAVHENGLLVISDTKPSDAGTYKCLASNVAGDNERTANVKVVEKVKITNPPADRIYAEYSPLAQLFCDAIYEPTLSYMFKWQKDGLQLVETDQMYLERRIEGPSRFLYFKNVTMNAGGEYSCRVYNFDGTRIVSEDSAVGSITVLAPPNGLNVEGNCNNYESKLRWIPIPSKAERVSYTLEYSASGSGAWNLLKENVAVNVIDLTKDILPPSVDDMIFRAKTVIVDMATNKVLSSGWSEATQAGTCSSLAGAPLKNPTNIHGDSIEEGELTIVWDQLDVVDQPGPGFRITVSYRKKGDVNFETVHVNGLTTEYEIPNAGTDQQYEVKLNAMNDKGVMKPTAIKELMSGGKAPLETVKNIEVEVASSSSVVVSWDVIDEKLAYRVSFIPSPSRRRRSDASEDVQTKDFDPGTNNGTLADLKPQTTYNLYMVALNGQIAGPKSETSKFTTKPSSPFKPSSLDVNVIGDTVQLKWTPPPPTSPSERIDSYTITFYKSNDPTTKRSVTVDGNEAFVRGDLEKMTYYTFEVAANSQAGRGEPFVVDGISVGYPDKPGKPAAPIVTSSNETMLNVTFKLDPVNGGGMPDKFHIYYKLKDTSDAPKKSSEIFPNETWIVLEDLETKTYTVWSTAENELGVSVPSDSSHASPHNSPEVFLVADDDDRPFYKEAWFIILLIILLLLIILCIILCCVMCRRGGKYPVGKKEDERGGWDSEPLKDYGNLPMEEMNGVPVKNDDKLHSVSNNSLAKKPLISDDDKDSLDDYNEDTKFDEDGSFIGQYGDDKKSAPPGATLV